MASRLIATVTGPSSPQARAIGELLDVTFVVCGVIFVVVAGLVGYCVVRFGAKGQAEPEPEQVEGNTRLEIAWTIVPAIIVSVLLVLTLRAMKASDPPVVGDPDVTVIGHQWWWEVRYKSGAVTANEIHVPTGRPFVFRIESADVVHDFWVPDLGRKIDAIPGAPTTITLQADNPGTYMGACAEYCGEQHAWMRILVIADTPEAFAAWEQRQLEPAPVPRTLVARKGELVFKERTCIQCHAMNSHTALSKELAGPDLTHIVDRTTLGAGVIGNSPEDLALWLQKPQQVKGGSHMPDLRLTGEETAALVAYLRGTE